MTTIYGLLAAAPAVWAGACYALVSRPGTADAQQAHDALSSARFHANCDAADR